MSAADYYGPGYQDIATRVPSIRRAKEILGWEPKIDFDTALKLHARLLPDGKKAGGSVTASYRAGPSRRSPCDSE